MYIEGNNHDRLLVALFVAGVFHAVLILGVSFDFPKPKPVHKSLDIVLVNTPAMKAPEKADFLAPEHQLGSGEAQQKSIPKTAPLPQRGAGGERLEPAPEQVLPPPVAKARPNPKPVLKQERAVKKVVADVGEEDVAEKKVVADTREEEPVETEHSRLDMAALSQQIADVSAALNQSAQTQAKRPKMVYINAVSAHRHRAAAYEAAWQQKVERIGNLNYPDEARRQKLSGSLTLAVGIKQDGSVYSIKLRESSGEPVLDDAAQRIVRMAAPFAAFPEELKQEADVLIITRTWRFSIDNRMQAGH